MNICNNLFSLQEICIIGGDYKEFSIRVNDLDLNSFLNIEDLKINFSIIPYIDRNGDPILSKSYPDSSDFKISGNKLSVTMILKSEDTINLNGKYIYQFSVQSANNKRENFQGIITVDKNINPEAFV